MGIWRARWLGREIARFLSQMLRREDVKLVTKLTAETQDAVELWNSLHILSLIDAASIDSEAVETVARSLVPRGFEERSAVLVRQYARVAARFVSAKSGESLIRRVLEIVRSEPREDEENNETYVNYYGGREAACSALLAHLSTPRTYDGLLHIHVLGQFGFEAHAASIDALRAEWSDSSDVTAAAEAIATIRRRQR